MEIVQKNYPEPMNLFLCKTQVLLRKVFSFTSEQNHSEFHSDCLFEPENIFFIFMCSFPKLEFLFYFCHFNGSS